MLISKVTSNKWTSLLYIVFCDLNHVYFVIVLVSCVKNRCLVVLLLFLLSFVNSLQRINQRWFTHSSVTYHQNIKLFINVTGVTLFELKVLELVNNHLASFRGFVTISWFFSGQEDHLWFTSIGFMFKLNFIKIVYYFSSSFWGKRPYSFAWLHPLCFLLVTLLSF